LHVGDEEIGGKNKREPKKPRPLSQNSRLKPPEMSPERQTPGALRKGGLPVFVNSRKGGAKKRGGEEATRIKQQKETNSSKTCDFQMVLQEKKSRGEKQREDKKKRGPNRAAFIWKKGNA